MGLVFIFITKLPTKDGALIAPQTQKVETKNPFHFCVTVVVVAAVVVVAVVVVMRRKMLYLKL